MRGSDTSLHDAEEKFPPLLSSSSSSSLFSLLLLSSVRSETVLELPTWPAVTARAGYEERAPNTAETR